MAGIINDHTDAATITPDANPNRSFCINAGMSRFMRNTKDAPNAVPRNGIRSVAKIGFMISFLCSNNAKIQSLPHFVNHNYNDSDCQQVHGLTEEDTEDAPVFPYVWEKVAPKIEGLPLVAHNSRFDEGCLREVFKVYQMDYPEYEFHDTLSASRNHFGCCLPDHQLQTVAAACGYDLTNHHHALADAEACAYIAIKLL